MGNYAFDYPTVLTNKAWQKNKGVIAKLAVGKTDVGAGLTALENEFAGSGFGKVTAFDGLDPLNFANYQKNLVANLQRAAGEIKKKIKSAGTTALGAYGEFQNSKTVPKSATQYVKSILTGLDDFEKKVDAYPKHVETELLADFRPAMLKTSTAVTLQGCAASAEEKWKGLIAAIKEVEKNPTVAEFEKVFEGDNPARLMTTICKMWDQLVAKNMPVLASSIYAGKAMTDYFTLPCLASAGNQPDKVASKEIKALIEESGQPEDRVVTAYMLKLSSSAIKVHEMVAHCLAAYKVVKAV